MPQIPTFQDITVPYPRIPEGPIEIAAQYVRRGQATLTGAMANVEKEASEFAIKEVEAQRATQAIGIEDQMNKDDLAIRNVIDTHSDYSTIDSDIEKLLDKNREKYQGLTKGDPALSQAVEKSFIHRSDQTREQVRTRRLNLMADYAKTSFDNIYDEALKNYATNRPQAPWESDEQYMADIAKKQLLIGTGLGLAGEAMVSSFALKSEYIRDKLARFGSDADMLQAMTDNQNEPTKTTIKLTAKNPDGTYKYYPNMDPLKRFAVIDHNLTTVRQQDAALEKLKRQAKEKDELNLSNLILDNKYIEAASLLRSSDNIVDKRTWENSIRQAQKAETRENDPDTEADLTRRLYGPRLLANEKDVNEAFALGKLNIQTYKAFLSHLQGRLEKDRLEFKSDAQRAQDKAFEHGERALGMKFTMEGPGSATIDREAKALHADALREYYGLVYQNKIDPDIALDTVINRYGRALDTTKDRSSTKLRRSLLMPGGDAATIDEMVIWLDANKTNMSNSTYQAQIRMIRDIEGLERSMTVPKLNEPKEKKRR